MTRMKLRILLALSFTHAVVLPVQAQTGSRLWRPEERVLISDMSVVEAVAADENMLYVVSPTGIGVYDVRFRQWQPPVTVLDGYVSVPVLSALVDPTDQSLWLGTAAGLVNYSPRMRWFETVAVAGGAAQLMMDRDDPFGGVYFSNPTGWYFLPRGGVIPQPVTSLPPAHRQHRPVTLPEVVDRYPEIATMRAATLLDQRLRAHRYTAAALVRVSEEVFLGTNGLGVVRYDVGIASFEYLPFGLLAVGASAVTVVPGGVWVGSDGRFGRSGFTLVSNDLQRFEFEEGSGVSGFGSAAVRQIVVRDDELWAATGAGVVVVQPNGNSHRITTALGLPSERVLSLAAGTDGVWVGTQRGLGFVDASGQATRVGARLFDAVRALAAVGDTVWVGARSGLGVTWSGSDRVVIPPGVAAVPELRDEVVALARNEQILVAALRDRIVWQPLNAPFGWTVERRLPELGELTSLAADRDGVWIGGARGFAHYHPETRAFLVFNSPGDVPGAVRDLAVDDRYLWVATAGGVVRFEKRAVR